jgi:hypothetical protein
MGTMAGSVQLDDEPAIATHGTGAREDEPISTRSSVVHRVA